MDESQGKGPTYKIAGRMLEPGMRDEEQKERKIRKAVVGGGDLKRWAEEGWRDWRSCSRGATRGADSDLLALTGRKFSWPRPAQDFSSP